LDTFLAPFLADFFALLFGVAAFCGVAWADPDGWAGAAGAALFETLLVFFPPAFLIFFDPVAFLTLLVTLFPAGFALAIKESKY
jgi:hypothetical protein